MGSEERQLASVLREKRKRLNVLERQVARFGSDAPPHMIVERDELRADLAKDEPVLEPIIKKEVSEDAQAALRQYGLPGAYQDAIVFVRVEVQRLQDEFRKFIDQRNRENSQEQIERRERQDQTDRNFERINTRITRLQWVMIVAMLILAFLIGGRFL